MKNLFVAFLFMLSLPALAQDRPTLTPQQKIVLAEAATALVTGPIVLPIAVVTGQRKELCDAIRMRPRSCFDDNSDGRDQCPCGNWLRIIPIIKDHINQE
jgi:hypothetical protein